MATTTKKRLQLTQGDRMPTINLPDQHADIINTSDKARGGPIFIMLYPSQKDPSCATELESLFALAPRMLAEGTHLFAVGGDPLPSVKKLAAQHDPGFFLMSDEEHTVADALGLRGKSIGFVLNPAQKIQSIITPGHTPIAERAATELAKLRPPEPYNPGFHPPILAIPQVLPRDFCAYLIEQFEKRGNEASGTFRVNKGKKIHALNIDVKQRRDHHVVDKDLLDQIYPYIERRVVPEIYRAFFCPIKFVEEFKIVRYDADPGGYFRPHRDNTSERGAHRRFAMTLNLNAEDYEGGELRFPEFDNATYKPATGEAVVFSCSLLHEATDVTEGQRYVLLSFMYDESGRQVLVENRSTM